MLHKMRGGLNMPNNQTEYTPPKSALMATRQNEPDALRLLIAQRRLYSRAKRWLAVRWLGMLTIGLAAPVISVIWPQLAVVAGAVAGLWIFLGRTLLVLLQSASTAKAAAVQEQFDFLVFGMPSSIQRSNLPLMEEISKIAGPDLNLENTAEKERLLDWYPVDQENSGAFTVAASQRTNAAYSDSLLRTTAIVWTSVTAAWSIVLIIVSIVASLSLLTFLVGVLLPILPAFLDVVQYVAGVWRSAKERRDLASSIECRLEEVNANVDGADLLVWQERLYDLRMSAPQVPDYIYKVRRTINERAMKSAATQLAKRVGKAKQ
ncbi:S-4TM family putative pore-forming effector [Amycolatopsis sp. NPDC001319]|uniref:S-4TM family putative pore-forming effector n=1 Tax=unclassified Amycolatopsis TaxID=2618356 RepID=UPI0036AFCC80